MFAGIFNRMRAWPAAAALMGALAIGAVGATAAPPMRIVSLAPGVTEILFALGGGGAVVGVSQYCDYPPAATRLPKVGTFLTPTSRRSPRCAPISSSGRDYPRAGARSARARR